MLGADLVYGFEVDDDAIDIALSNIGEILNDDDDESPSIQLIQCQIGTDFSQGCPVDVLTNFENFFDVVS